MPVYQYKCNQCGYRFEELQRMVDDPLTVCPRCSGPVQRLISRVGVVFKGSGFYVTDNKANSNSGNGRRPAKSVKQEEEKTTTPDKVGEAKTAE